MLEKSIRTMKNARVNSVKHESNNTLVRLQFAGEMCTISLDIILKNHIYYRNISD